MAVESNDIVQKQMLEAIEGAIDDRLNWLLARADGDETIIHEIEMLRKNTVDIADLYQKMLRSALRGIKEAAHQRDGYLAELVQIEQDFDDMDGAQHPLMKRLAQKMIDDVNERVDERAEQLFSDRYMEVMEDSVEYAEESVWDFIADEIGTVLDLTSFEGYDILHLLTGVGSDAMTPEHVEKFHEWVASVHQWNQDERNRRRNGGQ